MKREMSESKGKVFIVGNNKTGTTSLGNFLVSLGYELAPQKPAVRMYVKHLHEKKIYGPIYHYLSVVTMAFKIYLSRKKASFDY